MNLTCLTPKTMKLNLLDFLEFRQVLSTYDGNLRVPLWWPQERPVPMRVARGSLFADDMILYIENLKDSIRKLPS